MVRKILVPVDGSRKSKAGLEHALTTYGGESITALHVMTPHDVWEEGSETERVAASDSPAPAIDETGPETPKAEWYETARADAEAILDDAREQANEHDVDITTAVDVGEPWRGIVRYARENEFDHVILGSHGRRDDSPAPLGSVAETVMRRCPVMVSVVR